MEKQNFVIIGAAKAGTTSLYDYIAQHPQIYIPGKETNFFCQGNLNKYSCQTDSLKVSIIDEYKSLFKGVSKEIAVGEVCPAYMHDPEIAERIFYYRPHAKIIAILRHPVDRAYSNFLHCRLLGWETATDFAKALENEEKIYIPNHKKPEYKVYDYFMYYYKSSGFYYEKLKPYFDRFDKSQIKVYLMEDLHKAPQVLLKDLFKFLGVDSSFPIDVSVKSNVSGIPKNKFLSALAFRKNPIKSLLRPLIPKKLRNDLKRQVVTKQPLSRELRQNLRQEYREDILKLQDLIEQDLSEWLKE